MHVVPELVKLLGLSTENQVRNRIEAVRDLLVASLRRGPNNQILVTADGLGILRDLQSLCETGHTLTDAANILRYRHERDEQQITGTSSTIALNEDKREERPEMGWQALVEHLAAEVRELSQRVAALEAMARREGGQAAWWERWR
ncbi:MAG: hypothetical protein ABID40_02520 [Candidatus Bipolaricaulota bacterium]